MEGANKGQTPKKVVSVPKNSNSGEKEINENECNKVQNAKKPMAKNFMSPTISAASKVSAPKKKILGERNGIPQVSDANSLKSPNLGPRKDLVGQFSPKMISSYSFASESDDEDKSSITAYDPSSSYLSPRPKYLRYNPNRKRAVFLQLESMGGGGDGFSGEESDFKNVDGEVEEEIEEKDELQNVEEESKGNQCLDVNRSVVCDTENDSFQNGVDGDEESNRSEVFDSEKATLEEEVEGSKINQCLNDNRCEVVGSGNSISEGAVKMHNDKEENDDEEVEDLDEETEQYEEVHEWRLKRILKTLFVLCMFVLATLFAFSLHSTLLNSEKATAGPEHHYKSIQVYISEDVCMLKDRYGISIVEADMAVSEKADMVESESVEADMINEPVHKMLENATVDELTGSHAEDSNSDGNEEPKAQLPKLLVEADIVESEAVGDLLEDATVEELTDRHDKDSNSYANEESKAQLPELSVEANTAELTDSHAQESNSYANDEVPVSRKVDNIILEESVDNIAGKEFRLLQFKNKMAVVISALLSIMSGSLVFMFLSKGRKASKVSPITIEKLDSTEEPCPVIPVVEEKETEKLVQPSAASSLFDSSLQAAREFSKLYSPTVQLLGELVVREVDRSLRRCDQKVDNELYESEESNNVQERKKKKAGFLISRPPALASPEYSIADSPSCYGSFTTEAKILKRENGKEAEITTPVRRSSRIRSRSSDTSQ